MSVRPHRLGRDVRACWRGPLSELLREDPRAARARWRRCYSLDRPLRRTCFDQSFYRQVYLPWRLHPGVERSAARGRARRTSRHRRGDPAAPLRAHLAPLAPALPRLMAHGRRALRRTLLPHVGVLSGGGRDRVPLPEPHGVPGAIDQGPEGAAAHPRPHLYLGARLPRAGRPLPAAAGAARQALRRAIPLVVGENSSARCSQAAALAANIVLTTLDLCPTHLRAR